MSNPTSKMECTSEEAMTATQGEGTSQVLLLLLLLPLSLSPLLGLQRSQNCLSRLLRAWNIFKATIDIVRPLSAPAEILVLDPTTRNAVLGAAAVPLSTLLHTGAEPLVCYPGANSWAATCCLWSACGSPPPLVTHTTKHAWWLTVGVRNNLPHCRCATRRPVCVCVWQPPASSAAGPQPSTGQPGQQHVYLPGETQ
jgi:hypothetical protein